MSELSEYEALLNEVVPNEKQYIGKPCKRGGHSGLRWRSDRQCVECKREQAHERRRRDPAIQRRSREYAKEWYARNRKKKREYHAEWYAQWISDPKNRERMRERNRQRRQDPEYRKRQTIYKMYWEANKKKGHYDDLGLTLRNDGQKSSQSGTRAAA